MKRHVEGSYVNRKEAMQAIQDLKEKGYEKDEILVVANKESRDRFASGMDATTASESSVTGENEDERSFWEKIKDAFTMDEHEGKDSEEDPLYSYHDDLDKGNIIILVNEKNDIDEPFRADSEISDEAGDFYDSMGPVVSTGTGEEATSVQRATTDDIEVSKENNDLPGRDGDVFHTDQLPNNSNERKTSLHLDEAVDPDTSDVTGTESTLHSNPDVSLDETDVLDRSSVSTNNISPELSHPIEEEGSPLSDTENSFHKGVDKGLIGTSEVDDLNKHI